MELLDIVFLVAYLFTEFSNYTLAYHLVFGVPLKNKKGNWFLAIAIVLAFHVILARFMPVTSSINVSAVSMLVIPILLLDDTWQKRAGLYCFIVFGMSSMVVSSSFIVSLITMMPEKVVIEQYSTILVCQAVPTVGLILVYLYHKINRIEFFKITLGRNQYMLFYVGIINVVLMQASFQRLCQYDLPDRIITVCSVAISFSSMVFMLLILWHGIASSKELELLEYIQKTETYNKLKEEHIKQLVAQDEQIRRFRHDMNAHITALRGYCKDANSEEISEYLDNMALDKSLAPVKAYTGDRGVDAVLNELYESAKGKEIDISIKGTLAQSERVTSFELCSIFYNLVQNAIEACEKIANATERHINIDMVTYNEQNIICVTNTIAQAVEIKNGRLETTKADKTSHGIGTRNVSDIVKKHEGMINYLCENGQFKAEVII